MKIGMKLYSQLLICVLCAALLPFAASSGDAPPVPVSDADKDFQALCLKAASLNENELQQCLAMGKTLGRPYSSYLAVKAWLSRNVNPAPAIMLKAAEIAFLAADYRSAIGRYKTYLQTAPAGEEASQAAANLYLIMTDFMGSEDEAFQFMRASGEKYRSAAAKKFDNWFLDQARRRRDFAAHAQRLQLIFSEHLLPEQERIYYWGELEWLMNEVTHCDKEHMEALAPLERLAESIQGDPVRQARCRFLTAELAYKANRDAKDAAAQKNYQSVGTAAQVYFNTAPNAEVMQDIVLVQLGGWGRYDEGEWNRDIALRREFFVQNFGKLSDADKQAMLRWRPYDRVVQILLASTVQWPALIAQSPALFQAGSPNAEFMRDLPWTWQGMSPDQLKAQAAVTQGLPSRGAAIINALAAGSDPNQCVDYLFQKEAWHLGFDGWHDELNELAQALKAQPKDEKSKLPDNFFDAAYLRFGLELMPKSPIALFDTRTAHEVLIYAWQRLGTQPDTSKFIAYLSALDWVPYTEKERQTVIGGVYGEFKKWSGAINRKKDKDGKEDPQVAQAALLEEAFKKALEVKTPDPAKAPTLLCQKLSQAVLAIGQKNQADFLKLARELHPTVKDYDTAHTQFGAATLGFLLRNRLDSFDTFDFQIEVLADELQRYTADSFGRRLSGTLSSIVNNDRKQWRELHNSPSSEKEKALKVCGMFQNALGAMVDKGQFSPYLFTVIRWTRRGNRWADESAGLDLLDKMIQTKVLLKSSWRPENNKSATVGYIWLIRAEFQKLAAKYPTETAFDAMYVEEAKASGTLDANYWAHGGRDATGAISALAAQLFATSDHLPLGYDGKKAVCSRDEYFLWMERIVAAAPAVRDPLMTKMESEFGKTRFDHYAAGWAYFLNSADVATVSGRKEFFERLAAYVDKAHAAPVLWYPPFPVAFAKLGEDPKLTTVELSSMARIFTDTSPTRWPGGWQYEPLLSALNQGLLAQPGDAGTETLLTLVPRYWKIAHDTHEPGIPRLLAAWARTLQDNKKSDLAAVDAIAGLVMLGGGADAGAEMPDESRSVLQVVRSQALMNLGGALVSSRNDPRFPILSAQAAWAAGNFQSAWELALEQMDRFAKDLKQLDPEFCLWLLDKNIEAQNYDRAESMGRNLLQWFDPGAANTGGAIVEPEIRSHLYVSYANISFGRREYPRARAEYERLVAAREFEGTRGQRDAELKIAEVDRLTKQYDAAFTRLDKLVRNKDKYIQTESNFQFAVLKYDQEDYTEALKYIEKVKNLAPGHAGALLLEGNINLKRRKYDQATMLTLGSSENQRYIVPGRPLRISLEDRMLAMIGKTDNVEIRAWADSGDEEIFLLLPSPDSKVKFEGQIATALGAPAKGDHTLQLLGSDTVHYDFSPRFKAAHKLERDAALALSVATDAELYVSSGAILTKTEIEERALEKMIRDRLAQEGGDLNADKGVALSTVRPENQIKPGNNINVRVIDADRCVSNGKDHIDVHVSASSGDAIAAFPLEETAPYSGIFEGAVPTSSSEATAYATDSQEGRQPNFAISAGNHPAWIGLADSAKPKLFSVDLKDNVPVAKLNLAEEPGHKLKAFSIQGSLNGRDFATYGRFPESEAPWNGALVLEAMRFMGKRPPANAEELRDFIESGYLTSRSQKVTLKPKVPSFSWSKDLAPLMPQIGVGNEEWGVIHLYGAFAVPKRQIEAFRVNKSGNSKLMTFALVIDGESAKTKNNEFQGVLDQGVHRVDVFASFQGKAHPQFDLLCDVQDPPNMAICPADLFDPVKSPEIAKAVGVAPASIKPAADGKSYDIVFGENSRARVLRLVLEDFEGDAPAIAKIRVEDTAAKVVLPTKQDLIGLMDNQILEIVPGDKITVTYDDPKTLSGKKVSHEAFLKATYSNGVISACFVEYSEPVEGQERKAEYIPMRRFKAGEKVNVFVMDPDADVSDQPDKLKFFAKTTSGERVEMEALETGPHTGIFIGSVFPVREAPKRNSEIQVKDGEELKLIYFDKENTDPGIPWERTFAVEQAVYQPAELRVFDVSSQPASEDKKKGAPAPAAPRSILAGEYFPPARSMVLTRPEKPALDKPASILLDGPLLVELTFPTIALSPQSTATLYVQTASVRKAAAAPAPASPNPGGAAVPAAPVAASGAAQETEFDINLAGTVKLQAIPNDLPRMLIPPPGYRDIVIKAARTNSTSLDAGRFTFRANLALAPDIEAAVQQGGGEAAAKAREKDRNELEDPLTVVVRGKDELFLGFQYADAAGKTRWLTQKITLAGDASLDLMDRHYQQTVDSLYVSETLYLRVVHRAMDTTDQKDSVDVVLSTGESGPGPDAAKNGTTKTIKLMEEFEHGGIFKGSVRLIHADGGAADKNVAPDPDAMPVHYGDTITVNYAVAGGAAITKALAIHKGADGVVTPFTKQFKDQAIAMQTQLLIAESYFEMAKQHRGLNQEKLAREEIALGKNLLEEAMHENLDPNVRAQAEYLLANLAFEIGNLSEDKEAKGKFFSEALTRFSELIATYPDSSYAPKSQFKKGLIFQKTGQMELASEEFVKLSYRYPDNELVADTMARLGQSFMDKAKELSDQATNEPDKVASEKLKIKSQNTYRTSAQVFARLAPRFPGHALASKTLVLAGQCYILAKEMEKAVDTFKKVANEPSADNDNKAEALFWSGQAYMTLGETKGGDFYTNAYRVFKQVTWDFPQSKWAKFAQGRLAEPSLVNVGTNEQ